MNQHQRRHLDERLDKFLAAHEEELVALRRQLHAHPELSWDEHETTALVNSRLSVAGLEPRPLDTETGLVLDLGDPATGPTVALRADMDALPLDDEKEVPYRSTVPGACHACGHDVHTAILLGTTLALADPCPASTPRAACDSSSNRRRRPCPAVPIIWPGPTSWTVWT